MNTMTLTLIYLAAALFITRIPFLGVYLSLCNRLIEEIICVTFTKGETSKKIILNPAGQNVNLNFKQGFLTYIGLTITTLSAIGLFYLTAKGSYDLIIYLFIAFIAVSLLLWIRSFMGFMWAISYILLLGFPIYQGYGLVIMHLSIFLTSFILVQAIFHALKFLRVNFKKEQSTVIAEITKMVFGALALSQALVACYFIFNKILILNTAVIRFDMLNTVEAIGKYFSNYI